MYRGVVVPLITQGKKKHANGETARIPFFQEKRNRFETRTINTTTERPHPDTLYDTRKHTNLSFQSEVGNETAVERLKTQF